MEHKPSNKTFYWLLEEIQSWTRDGIITSEQKDILHSKYKTELDKSQSGKPDYLVKIISIIGALLIGLGIILFFAYNWDKFPRVFRVGVIISFMTGFYLGGWVIREKYPIYRNIGEAFIFLGVILFGSGIFLISEMYHIQGHYPNAFLFWALGAIAVSYITGSIPTHFLATVMLTIWNGTESCSSNPHHYNFWYFLLYIPGIFPFIYRYKTKLGLWLALICFMIGFWDATCVIDLKFITLFIYIALSCLMIFMGYYSQITPGHEIFKGIYIKSGVLSSLIFLFLSTFIDIFNSQIQIPTVLKIILPFLIIFFIMMLLSTWLLSRIMKYKETLFPGKNPLYQNLMLTAPMFLFIYSFISIFLFWGFKSYSVNMIIVIINNFIFMGYCYFLVYYGENQRMMGPLYWGILAFLIWMLARFFDLFESLLYRSIYFLIFGGLFIYLGFWLANKRKSFQKEKLE